MGLGTTELILILVIVLVLFGAKKLPEIGGGLARGIKSFRKNMTDEQGEKPAEEPAPSESSSKDESKPS